MFATKEREAWLTREIRERLWPYLAISRHGSGIAGQGCRTSDICEAAKSVYRAHYYTDEQGKTYWLGAQGRRHYKP